MVFGGKYDKVQQTHQYFSCTYLYIKKPIYSMILLYKNDLIKFIRKF